MRVPRLFLAVVLLAASATAVLQSPATLASGFEHPGIVSDNPVGYTPHVLDGSVLAVAVVGSRVYVGGNFTTIMRAGGTREIARDGLFAFERSTGRILGFAPSVDGAVETIAVRPDRTVVIGGRFKTVNGTAQRSLAALSRDGALVTSFTSRTNGYVTKALVRGSRLLVAGRFTSANGTSRANLALFDATTGTLDNNFDIPVTQGRTKLDGTTTVPAVVEMDANAEGTRLAIIGNFRQVGTQLRQQIAMIDLTDATVTPWFTNRYSNDVSGSATPYRCPQKWQTQMRDVDFAPRGEYFVVVTTGASPDRNAVSLCDTAARWEVTDSSDTTGATETWKNCTGGDTLYSTVVTGAAVYVGGHQRWLDNCGGQNSPTPGSFAAEGIGAIDPDTGLAIRTWNPGRTRGVGAEELVAAGEGLFVGSDTTRLGGEYHARVGLFPSTW